jgi:soluble lytic murein transglycosylase
MIALAMVMAAQPMVSHAAQVGAPSAAAPHKPAHPVRKAEAEFYARLAAAIAPVHSRSPDLEDAVRIRNALTAMMTGNYAEAVKIRDQIQDPLGRRIVTWYTLWSNRSQATRPQIEAFLRTNPHWPNRPRLRRRAEKAMFLSKPRASEVHAFFAKNKPVSGLGYAALAGAYLDENNKAKARRMAVKAWREHTYERAIEAAFLARFGGLLSQADHQWRLNRLLLHDARWRSKRRVNVLRVKRIIALLDKSKQPRAHARLAAYRRSKGALKKLARFVVKSPATPDWGLTYQRVQALRRAKRHSKAWALLRTVPSDAAQIISPDSWWVERRRNAYNALDLGKAKIAYEIARAPGVLSANKANDANFLAGWIALRFLKAPSKAVVHFQAMRKTADGPRTRAQSSYWLARSFAALGKTEKARKAYEQATKSRDTFYATLARLTLDPKAPSITIAEPVPPSADEIKRFNARDDVKAAVLAKKVGHVRLVRIFLGHLRYRLKSPGEFVLLAHLAEALADTQMSLRIAKTAQVRGHNLFYYAYPTHPLPRYRPLRPPPEPALILAIARQESEFNTTILSNAGARGILQVMPITARHVCQQHRIRACAIGRLMSDPAYNTKIGSAYIGDRMAEFAGSYVLTLAGYNAGPSRAQRWAKRYGDPRTPGIDPIDWIERIPFDETRNYVKKVLSNLQVYRARLGLKPSAGSLLVDLHHPRRGRRFRAPGRLRQR